MDTPRRQDDPKHPRFEFDIELWKGLVMDKIGPWTKRTFTLAGVESVLALEVVNELIESTPSDPTAIRVDPDSP